MRIYHMPLLSSWNGPASLVHVVQVLETLGVPSSCIRLLPVVGHFAHREILPYQERLSEMGQIPKEINVPNLVIRLGVNVRPDNRLARFVPLVALGMPPSKALTLWLESNEPLSAFVQRWYSEQYSQGLESILPPRETFVRHLAYQLCEQYHELMEVESSSEQPAKRMFLIRQQQAIELLSEYTPDGDLVLSEDSSPSHLAQEFVEIIFTNAFLTLALADMLGGFEFIFPMEPEGRELQITLNAQSRIGDVIRWLHLYPHRSLFPLVTTSEYERQRVGAVQELMETGQFGNAKQCLWTEQDPAVQQLYEWIRRQYAAGRTSELTPDEILGMVRRYLPEYIPAYPRQSSIIEGINLRGALLHQMHDWWQKGTFLGIDHEIMDHFTPEEKVVLEMLILLRRYVSDWFSLFQTALCLLVHRDIKAEIEAFIPSPSKLGTPFAQLQKTLRIGMNPLLHAPRVTIYIPLDHTQQSAGTKEAEHRLRLLARLFVPIHLPIRYRWSVDWAILGETAYIGRTLRSDTKEGVRRAPQARLVSAATSRAIETAGKTAGDWHGNSEPKIGPNYETEGGCVP